MRRARASPKRKGGRESGRGCDREHAAERRQVSPVSTQTRNASLTASRGRARAPLGPRPAPARHPGARSRPSGCSRAPAYAGAGQRVLSAEGAASGARGRARAGLEPPNATLWRPGNATDRVGERSRELQRARRGHTVPARAHTQPTVGDGVGGEGTRREGAVRGGGSLGKGCEASFRDSASLAQTEPRGKMPRDHRFGDSPSDVPRHDGPAAVEPTCRPTCRPRSDFGSRGPRLPTNHLRSLGWTGILEKTPIIFTRRGRGKRRESGRKQ